MWSRHFMLRNRGTMKYCSMRKNLDSLIFDFLLLSVWKYCCLTSTFLYAAHSLGSCTRGIVRNIDCRNLEIYRVSICNYLNKHLMTLLYTRIYENIPIEGYWDIHPVEGIGLVHVRQMLYHWVIHILRPRELLSYR